MKTNDIEKEPLNVIISGVGGQGNVLLSYLLGRALVKKGYIITVGETYGASQRGGSVVSHLRISQREAYGPLTPHGTADFIISLEPIETLRAIGEWGNPEVVVVSNVRPIFPLAVIAGDATYPTLEEIKKKTSELSKEAWFVDATDIALQMGSPLVANIIIGGAAISTGILPLSKDEFDGELRAQFSGEVYELNRKAFLRGLELIPAK